MSFDDFSADDPRQIVLGLFNGELQAAYLLREADNIWECHFTSRRDAPKDAVLAGARWVIDYFVANGMRLRAYVRPRNVPLRAFAEAVGLKETCLKSFPCQSDTDSDTLPREIEFIEYGA